MPNTPYRQLDASLIVDTLRRLRARIAERFPGAGLGEVSQELLKLGDEATASIDFLRRPHWPLRILVGVACIAAAVVLVIVTKSVPISAKVNDPSDIVQGIEACINILVFLGIALFFLLSLENRLKRRRALASLHQLRSVIHIVDMHQLTKDPEHMMLPPPNTTSSPTRVMSALELGRYLDYCSELLSLASKVAALFVQHMSDPVVLDTVSEIETLAGGYQSKIWQKITLLDRVGGRL